MHWGMGKDIQGWLPLLRGEGKKELGECLCEDVLVGDGELIVDIILEVLIGSSLKLKNSSVCLCSITRQYTLIDLQRSAPKGWDNT